MKVIQDIDGYIWIGTLNGLYKYDGLKLTVYRHQLNNPNSLVSNSVYELELDSEGNLLIGTGKGLSKYNRLTQTFTTFPLVLQNARITAICPKKNGELWIGTLHSGLFHFNSTDERGEFPTQYLYKPNLSSSIVSNQIHSLVEDNSGNIWVGTVKGLNKVSIINGVTEFIHFKEIDKSIKLLFLDSKGALWVSTVGHRLLKIENPEKYINVNNVKFEEFPLNLIYSDTEESGGLITMFEKEDGNLFLGIHGYGLYLLDLSTGEYLKYLHDPRMPESISSNNIESVFIDRSQVLWVGTEGGGLNKCDLKQKAINHLEHNILSKNSLSHSSINDILKAREGVFWVATQDGLNKVMFIDDAYKEPIIERFYLSKKQHEKEVRYQEPIWSILRDRDGDYWIGGVDGVYHMDINEDKNVITFNKTDFNMLEVMSIIEDSHGVLWFGSLIDGLIKWPKRKKQNGSFDFSNRIHYKPDSNNKYSISAKEISCIYEDSRSNLWVGTLQGGLNLVVPNGIDGGDLFVSFQYDSNDINSLSHNSVFSILEDSNGEFWIGTYGGGLNKMTLSPDENSDPKFKHYTEEDGLINNSIYGIIEDDNGFLWVSTDNGISSFNRYTEAFKNYNKEDGLQGNNFRKGAYLKNDDGYLFFGGYNGLNIFHPKDLKENDIFAPVNIVGFKIKNESINVGETYNGRILFDKSLSAYSKPIELNYHENTLTFEFSALHFAAPEKNQYKYMLAGFNSDWVESKGMNSAHYTNLPPGKYTFKVKASNNDGLWSEELSTINLCISPPFWQTWWAYFIYMLIVIALLWSIQSYFNLRSRERASLQVQKEIENINKLKLQFFTNISHEFKTPITLILNPIEELIELFKENLSVQSKLRMVERNANSLLRLVQQLMEFRRIEVGETKLKVTESNIVHFVREIIFSFQSHANRKDIHISFESSLNTIPVWFDWDKLEKILNNLIYNAIKFTPNNGNIEVSICKVDTNKESKLTSVDSDTDYVEIKVKDSGIGIDKSQLPYIFQRFYQINQSDLEAVKGSGLGLAITKDLVELHHGEILVESEKNLGTQFTIRLPLGRVHFLEEEIAEITVLENINEEEIDEEMLRRDSQMNFNSLNENNKKVVLIVDDNEDIRELVCNGLKETYNVLQAENGKEALKIVLKEIPDVVITDVLMPEMDGVQFCYKIKNNVRTSHIPVIMLTALNSVEHRIEGLESGADAYIPKPFKMKLLSVRIEKLIGSRELMRKRFQTEKEITPEQVTLNSLDEEFLKSIMNFMELNMANENYWIDELASDMNTSRSTFFRKLKKLTGLAPNDFMRMVRLKRSLQLLEQGQHTIAQVSYMVGFSHPNYFGKCFRKYYGQTPSEFSKHKNRDKSNV
ncbi:response regulator [Tamlana fucoidanivorans]|nr:two-component regulator propeller domain-containing protein [Tamlana fucoidanivorans]